MTRVANREGDEDRHRDDRRRDGEQETPAVPPPQPIVHASRPPQRDRPDTEQQEAREYRQQARVVVARRPDRSRVVDGLRAGEHAEVAQQERDRAAGAGAEPAVERGGSEEQGKRHEAANQMVARCGARIRLEEVVVEDVQRDDTGAEQEESGFGADSGQEAGAGRAADGVVCRCDLHEASSLGGAAAAGGRPHGSMS